MVPLQRPGVGLAVPRFLNQLVEFYQLAGIYHWDKPKRCLSFGDFWFFDDFRCGVSLFIVIRVNR